ncbi:MAG: hypothetical protein H8E48_06365 [Chloroflexi bacterium]|nr:hypothetical protein [Chloroflexota bacterium]
MAGTVATPLSNLSDIVTIKLQVQRRIGNDDRRKDLLEQIDKLETLLIGNPTIDISKPIREIEDEVFSQRHRQVALASVFGLLIATVAVVWWINPKIDKNTTFLEFNTIFLLTALGAGFLGSFVRILNKVINHDYASMSGITVAFVMILRPVAGATLGLFVAAWFAFGGIVVPIGDNSEVVFRGISKGGAFIFAVAFIAGLIDDFALNVANRFASTVRGSRESTLS